MKLERLVVVLMLVNVALLSWLLARTDAAQATEDAPVLRGRALQIVDEHGRIRASISVVPADPSFKMPDGTTGYPETVLLRLITPEGRPNVKIGASQTGAGLGLGGESDPTYIQVLAQHGDSYVKLTNKDGREQLIKP